MKKRSKSLLLIALTLFLIPQSVFAVNLPAIAEAYANIIEGMVVQIIVGLVILIMLIMAGWQMYENGNARPIKWAIAASIVMGGAVFFGDSMIAYAEKALGTFTGSGAVGGTYTPGTTTP